MTRHDEPDSQPTHDAEEISGSPWLKNLYDYFAPARAEAEEKGYTEEQINTWFDVALKAVRRNQSGRR
jgi:hypothetical protein